MLKKLVLLVVCAACLVALAPAAQCADLLLGVENTQFSVKLLEKDTDNEDYVARHSWSCFRMDYLPTEVVRLHLILGGLSSTLEMPAGETSGTNDALILGGGISFEFEQGQDGAFLMDLYAQMGMKAEWKEGTPSVERTFNHTRTVFSFTYALFDPGRARPYFGVAYNNYASTYEVEGSPDLEFEQQLSWNFVAGMRARSETFYGFMEAMLGGELGVRLGLEFGF
jgi:hypothetical protein